MNFPPLTGNEPAPNSGNHDEEMAAFLDSMLLLKPMEPSAETQESKTRAPGMDEKPTDTHESHVANTDSTPLYNALCLMLGLVNDGYDPMKYHDVVMTDAYKKIRSSSELFTEFRGLVFAVAYGGNLTEAWINLNIWPMRRQLDTAMENFGVRFAEHGKTSDPDKVDLAGFAMYFPGQMFTTLRDLQLPSWIQQFLPPEVSTHVPKELTFLQAGAFLCLLLKEADKKKLRKVVKYIGHQFCKQLVRESGHDEEHIRRSVLRTQALCTPPMEFLIKIMLKERDIVDALSRVNLPAKSATLSKKRINGKRMIKVKSSKA